MVILDKPKKALSLLSIVIITRNEAQNIVACIESALAASEFFPFTQILLVDSASTDGTCNIAQHYPISIVQLKSTWCLTPAAGRYIGTLRTQSEYILFLDGDMVLDGNWLNAGLEFMQTRPHAAAVSGDMDEIYLDDQGEIANVLHRRYNIDQITEVPSLGGAALYRHSALEKTGSFNPFVALREEAELALRLRSSGYKLYRIPTLITKHYSPPRKTLHEVQRRLDAGFFAGFGRALYYSFQSGLGWQFVREQGLAYLYFTLYLLIGLFCLIFSILSQNLIPFVLWAIMTAIVFITYALKKGSLRNALLGSISRGLMVYGSVVGVISAMRDPPDYPTDVIVISP